MKRLLLKTLTLAGCAWGAVCAREIRTPLEVYFAPYHHPVDIYNCDDCCVCVDVWGSAYAKVADDAWGNCGSREKVPFTQLIFGKADFRVAEAFPNATVGTALPNNPWVSISTITPRFEYQERGALFGFQIGSTFCNNVWRYGLRARLPIRDIQVNEVCGGEAGGNDLIGETLTDVFQTRQETIEVGAANATNSAWAARLDFLSAINRLALDEDGNPDPMVTYPATSITIAEENIGDGIPAATVVLPSNAPMVAVIKRDDGTMPEGSRWANINTTITGVVQGDGSGLANNQRGRVASDIAYAALGASVPAQSQLFVVPTVADTTSGGEIIANTTIGSNQILAAITTALGDLDDSLETFFEQTGIDFCDGRTKGLGDLDVELYLGRDLGCSGRWWEETQLGFRCPTGERVCDCKKVIKQPGGNNGHLEIRIGETIGWMPHDRVKLKLWVSYSWALSRAENIAAPFRGATVKNLGPCINGDVKWDFFLGTFDITFMATDCCGFDIGYEGYHKRCDQISLCQDTATDLAGRTDQPLDVSVITNQTERTSHKIRSEFFMNRGGVCELYTGYTYTVAGKNITRDTDYYLGIRVGF